MNKIVKELLGSVAFVDVETTGLDVKEDQILQMAIGVHDSINNKIFMQDFLYDCDGDVPVMASSIHNIVKPMLIGKPKFKDVCNEHSQLIWDNGADYFVAHNAIFDSAMMRNNGFDECGRKWICTHRLAKKMFNGDMSFENYTLNYLRYRLGVTVPAGVTHEAKFDVLLAYKVFECLCEILVEMGIFTEGSSYVTQLYDWLNEPIMTDTMPFGKHKGEKIIDIPMKYWEWAFKNMDLLNEESDKYDPDFAVSVVTALDGKI